MGHTACTEPQCLYKGANKGEKEDEEEKENKEEEEEEKKEEEEEEEKKQWHAYYQYKLTLYGDSCIATLIKPAQQLSHNRN